MLTFPRLILMAAVLLAALPARGDDQLPMLQSGNLPTLQSATPAQLPSLSTSNLNMAPVSDQTISATCYLGNPNDNNTLGSITVYSPAEAGINCNALFYACKGRCFGCYSDFDMSEDICVDASGRKFLR
jgi:hypothetical protein